MVPFLGAGQILSVIFDPIEGRAILRDMSQEKLVMLSRNDDKFSGSERLPAGLHITLEGPADRLTGAGGGPWP